MTLRDAQPKTTKRVLGTVAGTAPGQPVFEFKDVFIPQLVTLQNIAAPQSFLLTPRFDKNLALHLDVSQVKPHPQRPWTVPQTIIDSDLNVSVLMNDGVDALVLSGAIDLEKKDGQGAWISSIEPFQGTWTSQPQEPKKGIKLASFQWTLMIAPQNPTPTNPVQTVVLGFQVDRNKFWQVSSFPAGYTVTKFEVDNGIVLALTDPDGSNYCMTGGTFSGDIAAMVCNGVWTEGSGPCPPPDFIEQRRRGYPAHNRGRREDEDKDKDPLDGGTWTGTGGGVGP